MSARDADVLIVGAGIAGLTAAALLQARGVEVEIAERNAAASTVGAGILLHPNALRGLSEIKADVVAGGVRIARQLSFPTGGGEPANLRWDAVWETSDLPLSIHRHRLARQLLSCLDPATMRWGTVPIRLTQSDDCVEVRFAPDAARRYRIVLGADGVGSWVRSQVDPAAAARYLGQIYWRLTVPAEGSLNFTEWRVWRSGPHFFGGMPVGDERLHLFLQAALPRTPPIAPVDAHRSLIDMASSLDRPIPELAAEIDPDTEIHVGAALAVSASPWVRGRVALLGDAAHAASPALTQGGAMAIEDAAVVSEELLLKGLDPAALESYERRRRPRIAHLEQMSRLHLMLIETEFGDGRPSSDRREAEPLGWYRKIYGPFRAAA